MKHNHEYIGCEHTLTFCSHCDVAYCTTCHKEWKNNIISNNPWQSKKWEPISPWGPVIGTGSSAPVSTTVTMSHAHGG